MTDTQTEPYTGRNWLLVAKKIWGIRSLVEHSLRRSTPNRAMILPILVGFLLVMLAQYVLRLGYVGLLAPSYSITLGVFVFWPAALAAAIVADLVRKEYKFQAGMAFTPA